MPAQIPGRIEAEDFDLGPEGAAYHLVLASSPSSSYRGTDVALGVCTDTGGGYCVGLGIGEWVAFTVEVPQAGVYQLSLRGATYYSAATFHLESDGEDVSGPLGLAYALGHAGFGQWGTESREVIIGPGRHVIRLVRDRGSDELLWAPDRFWINWLELTPVTPRTATVVAGTGMPGYADGPAAQAQFSTNIAGLDVDLAGNLYVADAGNLRVRKLTPQGEVSTLAGTGEAGYVDGPGAQAKFTDIGAWRSLGAADDGTVYVADNQAGQGGEHRIRRISPAGIVSTYWSFVGTEDWAAHSVLAVSVDANSQVVCSRRLNQSYNFQTDQILRIGLDSVPHEVAKFVGMERSTYFLLDAASAHTANVYFTAEHRTASDAYPVRLGELTAGGASNTLYEVRCYGYAGEGPQAVTADRAGHVFLIDWWTAVSELLPTGQPHVLYRSTTLGGPLCADAQGNVYFFDNHRILKLSSEPAVVLRTIATAGGSITTSLPGPYPSNTVVTATAVPEPGWSFLGWSGDASGTTPQLELTMSTHRRVNAAFGTTLNLSKTDGGNVIHSPALGPYRAGTRVTLLAIPQEGYEFTKWSDGDTNLTRVVEIAGPLSLKATFTALPRYQVTAAVLGGVGGTVELSPARSNYWRGQAVTVIARPASGYVFQVWMDNLLTNPRVITPTENLALFAVFAPGQQQAPQVVTGVGDRLFRPGDRVELTVAASGGAPLEYSWAHNGQPIAAATKPTLVLPFAQPIDAGQYTVTVSNSAGQATSTGQLELQNAPQFRIDARPQWGGGTVVLVEGVPGLGCMIEASSDLQNWQPLVVFTNSMQVGAYLDPPAATVNRRYYRALGVGGR